MKFIYSSVSYLLFVSVLQIGFLSAVNVCIPDCLFHAGGITVSEEWSLMVQKVESFCCCVADSLQAY